MFKKLLGACVLAILGMAGSVDAARATFITYNFTATIGDINLQTGTLSGFLTPGDVINGAYTFDLSQPDEFPGDLSLGEYKFRGSG